MHNPEKIQIQEERLEAHRSTLAHYLKQQALQGSAYIPPGIANGMREARHEIGRIKAILRGWNVTVLDLPDDDEEVLFRSKSGSNESQLVTLLENNNIGNNVIIGGIYQGQSMQVMASDWCEYGSFGIVRSGWLFIPQLSSNHAITFFKAHKRHDKTGYLHIVDVSDPPHVIMLSIPQFNFTKSEMFDYKNHLSALWSFQWPE